MKNLIALIVLLLILAGFILSGLGQPTNKVVACNPTTACCQN